MSQVPNAVYDIDVVKGRVFAACRDGTIQMFDAQAGKLLKVFMVL